LVHLLAGFTLLFAVGAADAAISLDQAAAPATNGVPRFDISRFGVEGNTLLDAAEVQALQRSRAASVTFPTSPAPSSAGKTPTARAAGAVGAVARATGSGVVRVSVLQTPLGKVLIGGSVMSTTPTCGAPTVSSRSGRRIWPPCRKA
jgi:hypothetical protein